MHNDDILRIHDQMERMNQTLERIEALLQAQQEPQTDTMMCYDHMEGTSAVCILTRGHGGLHQMKGISWS